MVAGARDQINPRRMNTPISIRNAVLTTVTVRNTSGISITRLALAKPHLMNSPMLKTFPAAGNGDSRIASHPFGDIDDRRDPDVVLSGEMIQQAVEGRRLDEQMMGS